MTRRGSITFYCRTRDCDSEVTFHRDDHLPSPEDWICPACEDAQHEQQLTTWAEAELAKAIERVNFAADWPKPINLNYYAPATQLTHKKAGA